MEHGLVTVVLPIYNVEKYLDRCINSVVNQTYVNLEILLIDDGSPDNCPKMCDDWAKRDSRIRVIHKENAGLGMARNTGIDNATGEYICFFDSDDYIAEDAVKKAYSAAKENDADTVLFGFGCVGNDNEIYKNIVPNTDKDFFGGDEVQNYVLPNLISSNSGTGKPANLWMSAWACMYSMSLIEKTNWRFVSEREYISEDVYSLLNLYANVNRVAIVPESLYFYCDNDSSLTHKYRKDRYAKNKFCYHACIKTCDDLGYCPEVKKRLAFQYTSNIIGTLKLLVSSNCGKNDKMNMIREIVCDNDFQNVIHRMDLDGQSLPIRILFSAMRKKMCKTVYFLIKAKA